MTVIKSPQISYKIIDNLMVVDFIEIFVKK